MKTLLKWGGLLFLTIMLIIVGCGIITSHNEFVNGCRDAASVNGWTYKTWESAGWCIGVDRNGYDVSFKPILNIIVPLYGVAVIL